MLNLQNHETEDSALRARVSKGNKLGRRYASSHNTQQQNVRPTC